MAVTIKAATGTPALTGYILYTDAATGTYKKALISALKTTLALAKADVGLANVDNTSDANKPVSAAQAAADAAVAAAAANATNLASGSIPADRFGSATIPISAINATGGTSASYLQKNGTWSTPPGGGGGSQALIMKHFVDDLGGVGDDATDNTAAFTAAMALDATQYYLFIPGGIFRTHTVDINPQLNIIGIGADAWNNETVYPRGTVIKSISAEPLFRFIVDDWIALYIGRLEYIEFDGNDIGTIGLDLEGVHGAYFHRCGFRNFTDRAIKMVGTLVATLHKITFRYNENDVTMVAKTYTSDGGIAPNFIQIIDCKAQWTKKWCFQNDGGSTLYIIRGDFERCGTTGVDSGVVKVSNSGEGVGLVFRENYVEQTFGFATVNIQPSNSSVMRFVLENNQFNASGSVLHDVYVDATGGNKQRVYIANSLMRNGGGLTVAGSNAFIHIVNTTFSSKNIASGVKVLEVTDNADIIINGVPVVANSIGVLPVYSNLQIAAMGLDSSDALIFLNSDDSNAPHIWDGSAEYSLDKTPYSPSISALIFDNFNRADNASSLGSSIVPASVWPPHSGTWGIQSNQAYCPSVSPSGSVTYYMAARDAGASDFTLVTNMTMTSDPAAGGVVFRWQDDNNTLFVSCYIVSGTSGLDVYRKVSGTATSIGGYGVPGALAAGVPFELKVVCAGTQIDIYLNGTHVVGPLTEAALSTETFAGMMAVGGTGVGGAINFDDFTVT